jgi:hypothetical protein
MKKWILKAIVQKIISWLPGAHSINFLFQKYVTKGVQLSDDYFYDRLTHARAHLQFFQQYAHASLESSLELGTGWYPVVPVSLFLNGASVIYTLDISPLCNHERLMTTLNKFKEAYENGRLQEYYTPREDRMAVVLELVAQGATMSFEALLERMGLQYLVKDARATALPEGTITLVHSNNTFEHVHAPILKGILAEFQRVVHPEGIQSHFIDLSDHFAHFDHSITIYNYLRFSRRAWQWIDNEVQPQNRLRWKDYLRMYQELGLPVLTSQVRPGDEKALATVPVHAEYTGYSAAELAISHGYLVSGKSSE